MQLSEFLLVKLTDQSESINWKVLWKFRLMIPMEAFHLDCMLCAPKGGRCWIHRVKTPSPRLLKLPVKCSQWLLAAYHYRFHTKWGKVRSGNSHFNYWLQMPFSEVARASKIQPVFKLLRYLQNNVHYKFGNAECVNQRHGGKLSK